jgi:formylmethanofuran dehydrogenase subunit E
MKIRLYDIRTTAFFVVAILFPVIVSTPVYSEEIDCAACHEDLVKGTSVHQAVSLGCSACHGGIDASDIPHQ